MSYLQPKGRERWVNKIISLKFITRLYKSTNIGCKHPPNIILQPKPQKACFI